MKYAKLTQYLVAIGLVATAAFNHDEVMALVGLWLSPSAITLLENLAKALAGLKRE